MRRILIVTLMALSVNVVSGQTTLLECGQNSGQNFNGWYISPHHAFDAVEFDAYSTSFFSEEGGNYAVTVTRKIDAMQSYKRLNLLFNFEAEHNCTVENVVYYISADGKNWTPISASRNNKAVTVTNDSLDITYIRATANTAFYKNGKLSLNYAKVIGDLDMQPEPLVMKQNDEIVLDNFFIFNHLQTLNVETSTEKPYEVMITSISGQIVYREQFEGSNRVELPADLSGVFVVTIIQDNDFKASKKIVMNGGN